MSCNDTLDDGMMNGFAVVVAGCGGRFGGGVS